jgi:universal stress protein E
LRRFPPLEFPMTRPIRRILVAVKDVRGRPSRTLRKAAKLARALDAKLELFHAITDPIAVDALDFANQGLEKLQAGERRRYLKRLETLAAPLRRSGLDVSVSVEWDFPAHEALIRRARRSRADLIVAERHIGQHVAPWFLRYTDWELLRQSPVPVLLVKTAREYNSPRVLAAIDPAHAFDKTARLDDEILRVGARICAATRGQLHAVHAYIPTLQDASPAQLSAPDASGQIITHAATRAQARLDKALRSARLGKLGPDRRHLLARHPVDAIPELVRKLGCDIVVMGAISRSGMKRVVIGNTAERLLDDLPCDLLIVKPPSFVSSVAARSRDPHFVAIGVPYGTV